MILQPGTKFAAVALANVHPDFEGDILISERYACTTTCPFTLDSGWQTWLGSVAVDTIQQSDIFLLVREPAKDLSLLDDQNTSLLNTAETLLMCLHLVGVPGCSSNRAFTGTVDASHAIDIRQTIRLPDYRESRCSTPSRWKATDIKTSIELEPTMSRIRSDTTRFHQLRRGLGAYLSALEATDCRDRLHQAVRSLEALTAPTRSNHGATSFEDLYQRLLVRTPQAGFLGDLYRLRSYVEHSENCFVEHARDPNFIHKVHTEDEFKQMFERYEAQAVDLARSVYLRIIADPDALTCFEDEASIPLFWSVVEHRSATCAWICPVGDPAGVLDEDE